MSERPLDTEEVERLSWLQRQAEPGPVVIVREGDLQALEAQVEAYREARRKIEQKWSDAHDEADRVDDDGGHVGIATYYRNLARGLGEAMQLLDQAARHNEIEGSERTAGWSPEIHTADLAEPKGDETA